MDHNRRIDFENQPVRFDDQLKKSVENFPGKIALTYENIQISYEELELYIDILARHLIYSGLKKGDRVFLALHRRPEVVIAFLAIVRAGGIAVPLNFRAALDEIASIRKYISPAGMICHSDLKAFTGKSNEDEWIIELKDLASIRDLENPIVNPDYPEVTPDDPVYLNLTSGSTGRPKAAIASQRQLFSNTSACCQTFEIGPEDIHLPLFAVMSHPHEIFCRALLTSGQIVLIENLYPRSIAQAITQYKVTCVMAVAPVYDLLLPFASNAEFDFSSLRLPESGGMSTQAGLAEKFHDAFGVQILPVWGSTETMGVAFASDIRMGSPSGSVGRQLPGYETKIVGQSGESIKTGQIGELMLRGPGVMQGYWRGEEESRMAMVDGWYRTGDLFMQDPEGNYYCHGRIDAMIKVGGLKVYPAEIEAVLFSHPLVREAVVVPFHDRLRGIVPLAAVVIEPGENLTEAQLKQFLRERLSRYKIPRVIRFMPSLPRTAGGKIDLKSLTLSSNGEGQTPEVSLQRRMENIDLKILHLLNERLKLAIELQQLNPGAAFHPELIEETLRKLQQFNPGPLHDSIVEELFREILSIHHYL